MEMYKPRKCTKLCIPQQKKVQKKRKPSAKQRVWSKEAIRIMDGIVPLLLYTRNGNLYDVNAHLITYDADPNVYDQYNVPKCVYSIECFDKFTIEIELITDEDGTVVDERLVVSDYATYYGGYRYFMNLDREPTSVDDTYLRPFIFSIRNHTVIHKFSDALITLHLYDDSRYGIEKAGILMNLLYHVIREATGYCMTTEEACVIPSDIMKLYPIFHHEYLRKNRLSDILIHMGRSLYEHFHTYPVWYVGEMFEQRCSQNEMDYYNGTDEKLGVDPNHVKPLSFVINRYMVTAIISISDVRDDSERDAYLIRVVVAEEDLDGDFDYDDSDTLIEMDMVKMTYEVYADTRADYRVPVKTSNAFLNALLDASYAVLMNQKE